MTGEAVVTWASDPVPTAAFKFLRRVDEKFVYRDHTLWLSDAAHIRRSYEGRAGSGDRNELAAGYRIPPDGVTIRPGHPLYERLLVDGVTVAGHPMGSALQFNADAALFCASASVSEEIFWKMRREFGYDSYFVIHDLPGLFARMAEIEGAVDALAGPVHYTPHRDDRVTIDPLLKTSPYRWQDEVRLVFPNKKLVPPDKRGRKISIPDLADYISEPKGVPQLRRYRR